MIIRFFKNICVRVLGRKNVKLLKAYLLRALKGMPRYYLYPTVLDTKKDSIIIGRQNSDVFFGYYDISPFSRDGSRVLCHIYDKKEKNNSSISLGYYDITSDQDVRLSTFAKTQTWCWQMGARLQWLPSGSDNLVIFNTLAEDGYGSIVMDVDSRKTLHHYDKPVYSLSNSGRTALYLNFNRLHRLRPGYGYRNFRDKTEGKSAPNDDGLYMFDLDSGKSNLLYSLREIKEVQAPDDYGNVEHYINHILWNPSGDKYLFFHIWRQGEKRYSRLMVGGTNLPLKCAYWPHKGNVSHYAWKNDKEILLTASDEKKEVRYILIDVLSNTQKIIGNKILTSDGHPSFSPRSDKIILTDTYPDKFRNQLLFLYDMENELQKNIAYFYSPGKFKGEYRCDLHPRFSHDGSKICVDSPHSGQRQMLVISPKV